MVVLGTVPLDLTNSTQVLAAHFPWEVGQPLPAMVPAPVLPLALLTRAALAVTPQLEPGQWELLLWRATSLVDTVMQPAQAQGPGPVWGQV